MRLTALVSATALAAVLVAATAATADAAAAEVELRQLDPLTWDPVHGTFMPQEIGYHTDRTYMRSVLVVELTVLDAPAVGLALESVHLDASGTGMHPWAVYDYIDVRFDNQFIGGKRRPGPPPPPDDGPPDLNGEFGHQDQGDATTRVTINTHGDVRLHRGQTTLLVVRAIAPRRSGYDIRRTRFRLDALRFDTQTAFSGDLPGSIYDDFVGRYGDNTDQHLVVRTHRRPVHREPASPASPEGGPQTLLEVALATPMDLVTVDSIVVQTRGGKAGLASGVEDLLLVEDLNRNGQPDAGDTVLDSAPWPGDGGYLAFDPSRGTGEDFRVTGIDERPLLVAARLSPHAPYRATLGMWLLHATTRIAGLCWGTPVAGDTIHIAWTDPSILTVSARDVGWKAPEPGADVPALALRLAASGAGLHVNALEFCLDGSGNDPVDLRAVRLIHDVNGDGRVTSPGSPGGDRLLDQRPALADDGTLTLAVGIDLARGGAADLLVVLALGTHAPVGRTFHVTAHGVTTDADEWLGLPLNSAPVVVTEPAEPETADVPETGDDNGGVAFANVHLGVAAGCNTGDPDGAGAVALLLAGLILVAWQRRRVA